MKSGGNATQIISTITIATIPIATPKRFLNSLSSALSIGITIKKRITKVKIPAIIGILLSRNHLMCDSFEIGVSKVFLTTSIFFQSMPDPASNISGSKIFDTYPHVF